MVDVGAKPTTERKAVARGRVKLGERSYAALSGQAVEKGDVLAAARIAGIMAAKRTPDLIPLCHTVALSSVKVNLELSSEARQVEITAIACAKDRTGVEMEALTAVSVAALTVYDMLKAVDRSMVIEGIELVEKSGGRSGHYVRPMVAPKTAPMEVSRKDAPTPPPPARSAPSQPSPAGAPPPSMRAAELRAEVRELDVSDPALRTYLSRDPLASAYMLGDLDLPYAEHGRWYGLPDTEDGVRALLLLYEGLSMPAVLTSGDADEVEALLGATRPRLPRRFYAHIRDNHRRPLEVFYELRDVKRMVRMGLRRADYVAFGDPSGTEPLSHRDTGPMMALYAHYPDNFFDPALLDTGLYFGLREGDELLSVAGIHVLSERNDVAAIGNIVTHREHRGRGLASRCVRRLLDELFDRVEIVALNVEADNSSALACYRKFGFATHYAFFEGSATLR